MIWRALSALDRRSMRRRGGSYLNTLNTYGTYRCRHTSHRMGLNCLRYWRWNSYCGKHANTCDAGCP